MDPEETEIPYSDSKENGVVKTWNGQSCKPFAWASVKYLKHWNDFVNNMFTQPGGSYYCVQIRPGSVPKCLIKNDYSKHKDALVNCAVPFCKEFRNPGEIYNQKRFQKRSWMWSEEAFSPSVHKVREARRLKVSEDVSHKAVEFGELGFGCEPAIPKLDYWNQYYKEDIQNLRYYQVHEKYVFCNIHQKGLFSAWFDVDCSKNCGGGFIEQIRVCRYPPCTGNYYKLDNKRACNKEPCVKPVETDCYHGTGTGYFGETVDPDCDLSWGTELSFGWLSGYFPGLDKQGRQCRNFMGDIAPFCLKKGKDEKQAVKVYCKNLKPCMSDSAELPAMVGWKNYNGDDFDFVSFSINKNRVFKKPHYCDFTGRHVSCANMLKSGLSANGVNTVETFTCFTKEGYHATCHPSYQGTWSEWIYYGCSKPCNGGKRTYKRHCLYPPCANPGKTIKTENESCNTQKCKECFSGRGQNYAGKISKTWTGEKCKSQTITNNGKIYNFDAACRSHGVFSHPMCYISKSKWHYCDVPSCIHTEIRPFPLKSYGHLPTHNLPITKCKFPFYYNGIKYSACSKIDSISKDYKVCGTSKDSSETQATLAICSDSSVGSLSDWEDTLQCTKKCDNGKRIVRRVCLNPPCGKSVFSEKHVGSCNDFPCTVCVLEGTRACVYKNLIRRRPNFD